MHKTNTMNCYIIKLNRKIKCIQLNYTLLNADSICIYLGEKIIQHKLRVKNPIVKLKLFFKV